MSQKVLIASFILYTLGVFFSKCQSKLQIFDEVTQECVSESCLQMALSSASSDLYNLLNNLGSKLSYFKDTDFLVHNMLLS
jgi:hypothetical protein